MARRRPNVLLPSLLALLVTASSVAAAPLAIDFADVPGPLDGGFRDLTFAASGPGAGTLTIDVIGYGTVDGANALGDQFRLSLNGALLFATRVDMGGGGPNSVDFAIPGAAIVSTMTNGFGRGGLTRLSVPLDIETGTNSVRLDYGMMQGLFDEGWGYRDAQVRGDVAAAVPEPALLGLFGVALLAVGWRSRRA